MVREWALANLGTRPRAMALPCASLRYGDGVTSKQPSLCDSLWPDVSLTETERALIEYLARSGDPVPGQQLLAEVWGYSPRARSRTIEVTVHRVRKKIERDPSKPEYLLSVRGRGYQLVVPNRAERMVPNPTAEHLHQQLRERLGVATGDVSVVVRRERRTNVGVALDGFFGRQSDMETLDTALRSGGRLITLIGMGGLGKTRLARQVALRWGPLQLGGAWFCEVTEVVDASATTSAVADTLGLMRWPSSRPLVDHVADVLLAAGPTMLVLDNAEHLSDEAVEVVGDLLGRCPQLQVVATSRRALGLPGEWLHLVEPLRQDEAVDLFCERAEAVRLDRSVPLDRARVAAVVDLVERIPLAIELAAARARTVPLVELLARLRTSLSDLGAGPRTGAVRHRTLRDTFLWSWGLLTPAQQGALAQLAVFRGGFTLEAARVVLDGPIDAVQQVSELMDRSLVRPMPEQPGRLGLFETVRQFALEEATISLDDPRRRHAQWITELAAPVYDGDLDSPALALRAEVGNAVAALEFQIQRRSTDAVTVVFGLAMSSFICGLPDDMDLWCHRVRAALEPPAETSAWLYLAEARWLDDQQRRDSAALAAEQGLLVAPPESSTVPSLCSVLAHATARLGRLDEARASAERALAHPLVQPARAFSALGAALYEAGDLTASAKALAEAVRHFKSTNQPISTAVALRNLTVCSPPTVNQAEQWALLDEAITALKGLDVPRVYNNIQERRLVSLAKLGRMDEAAGIARYLLAEDRAGRVWNVGTSTTNAGIVLLITGDLPLAKDALERGYHAVVAEKTQPHVQGLGLSYVVVATALSGEVADAKRAMTNLTELDAQLSPDWLALCQAQVDLATTRAAAQPLPAAQEAAWRSLIQRTATGHPFVLSMVLDRALLPAHAPK
ncbi:MAG: putative ATPase/DNA-binding winged helix-turn-helix (wHTH) protein [Myxococcota bacterium]|jgi:predicted ATPase/DNA-binding winged helix-turn-helix (wHTH) protein/tetratricopeptide (TPR) repeat protein